MVDTRRLLIGAASAAVAAGGALATGRAAVRRARRRDDPQAAEDFTDLADLQPPVEHLHAVGRDGSDLHVLAAGRGRPLVLLHGVTLQAGAWRYQFALADRCRVLAADLRGHGRSRAGRAGYGLDPLADDLADLLISLDLRGAVLVGHSMGGMTIMRFAHRHPDVFAERVRGLLLVSTSADPVLGLGTASSLRGVAAAVQVPLSHVGWKRVPTYRPSDSDLHFGLVRLSFGDAVAPHLVEVTRRMVAAMDAEALNRSFLGLLANDEHAHLHTIKVPTLVVVGSRDLLTPPRASRRIAAAITGAELHVIPGAGHQLMMERPDELNALLGALLDRLDAGPGRVGGGDALARR